MAADPVPAGRPPDLAEKLERLRLLAREHGVDTLVLREPATLTWLLGARVHVPQTLDTACLDVVVEQAGSAPSLRVVTTAIEAPRLRETELAGLEATWTVVPWWEGRAGALPTGGDVGSDRPLPGARDVAAPLAAARCVLTTHQAAVLTAVAEDAAAAVTAAAGLLGPAHSEYAVAGALARELLERGTDPVVLLVAGDDRIGPHRHPLPTTAAVGRRVMMVCCARRHGVIASLTRTVAFGPVPPAAAHDHLRLLDVEAAFLDATEPGRTLGEVLATGAAAYGAHGLPAQEWHRHHQGGLTGWVPREVLATPTSSRVLEEGHAVAWNPSGGGWKVEDTWLLGPAGVVLAGSDPHWPTVGVAGRDRPDVLVR